MRAERFKRAGEPADVLWVDDVATPVLTAGQVLLAIEASVVQPADSMFVRGRYRIRSSFP